MKGRAFCLLLVLLVMPGVASGLSIVNSKHNLSVSGPGTVKAASETQICIFCHTPHNSSGDAPLWNRFASAAPYILYNSTTAKASPGQPTGSSKLCLSCHDGTIALGQVRNPATVIPFSGGITTLPAGPSLLGTDLSDDHPISFVYDATLATANGQLKDPAILAGPVRLDASGQLQCTSCHEPHNDQNGKFLAMNNFASALCNSCHNKTYWSTTTHSTSSSTWNGLGTNPWPHTSGTTVAANGCENCHRPHSAGNPKRLLNYGVEESNCYSCHNGNVASKNIQTEFNKSSIHPVASTNGVHDPSEDPVNPSRHVECVDCHNPHAANSSSATAPNAPGALAGVKGINATGNVVSPVTYGYELCFRCHADSTNRGAPRINRQFAQTNTRIEFSPSNASFHPVESVGRNPNVPSLMSPWTTSSVVYCTDCHNNDQGPGAGGSGPKGPHGSSYIPILERQMIFTDNTPESSTVYALCYKCHSRTSILNNQSFSEHSRHISSVRTPCTTCHDPHGVASVNHLINFNTDIVSPNSSGILRFDDLGTFSGRCYLRCHNQDHGPKTYP